MDKDLEENTHRPFEHEKEDFDYDAFFNEEYDEEYEKSKEQKKKRKKLTSKAVGWVIILVLLVNGLAMWPKIINLPAVEFLAVSARLTQQDNIKEMKKSVVTIEWAGVKGTGFNVESDGLIITNEHVVDHTSTVNVHFKAGDSYAGRVIASYPELDIAVVDIEASDLPVLPISYGDQGDIGDPVTFIGNPLSFTQIANVGVIVGETLLSGWEVPVMMIEAPIYKGNSGSPVINEEGQVIGVIFATLQNPDIETKEIVGVATPSSYIEEIINQVND
ncbi:S1-C subfamily serine protease [Bacillus mesophilus]|uniref:Trypsin-like peptidase domain-containing protein n=1 Tax=Bacillus mesophilus TaxID=1808955 RepID=A0A6M0QBL5_9BACI|nr:serine protease [Bacillus mesophilus]MBM7660077.1 S1-C subfamily serine protease [Bacillus mesophilus]NEY73732.1 trypsin-like peptidase domain-containing protein [Bacillus mesophilus]